LLASALNDPWGFVFLPDGRLLMTQRSGSMIVVNASGAVVGGPFAGLPASPVLSTQGQGGLLDVVLDPDYGPGAEWIYYAYSEQSGSVRGTAVNRARLDLASGQLLDTTTLFRQTKDGGTNHYGSRLAFKADKTLFITLGEKQAGLPAQSLGGTLGKVVRINRDGSFPTTNPNMGAGAAQGIWSYGHRNPQGALVHPVTDELWVNEHGPQGGDELNRVLAGQNFGWPNKSYGCDYGATGSGCQIGGGGGVHSPTYTEPMTWWPGPGNPVPSPSIAPSGLMYYDGSAFPEWQGNLFMGALAGTAIWRIVLNSAGTAVASRERLTHTNGSTGRVRCIRQGPDGRLYFITTNGSLYRVDRA
jgi:glucose/arabinose dehydrogenase